MNTARDVLKLTVGRIAELALPSLGREIDEVRNISRGVQLKRAIVYARLRRAYAHDDKAEVCNALTAFWKAGLGARYHNSHAEARFNLFRERHAIAVDTLAGLLASSNSSFTRLVEIGCGHGRVLADCTERLPSIAEAIGLDISPGAIARASDEHPSDGRLSFVTAEAQAWLTANPQPGTVVLSNNGVVEFLSQDSFDKLLQALAGAPPAAIVLIEPVAPDHDLQTQFESYNWGLEYSFSHNHRARLTQAGFDVVFEKETHDANWRLMLMVGLLDCPGPTAQPHE